MGEETKQNSPEARREVVAVIPVILPEYALHARPVWGMNRPRVPSVTGLGRAV